MRPELCKGLRLVKISLHKDILATVRRIERHMRNIDPTKVDEESWKKIKREKYDILKVFFKTIKGCQYNCELY